MAGDKVFEWRPLAAGVAAVLVVVGSIGGLLLLFIRAVSALDSEVARAVVGASGVVTVSILTLAAQRYFERKRQLEADARLRKMPLYENFVDFWFRTLYQKKLGKAIGEKEVLKFFVDFTKGATVWASDEVLAKWRTIKREFAALAETGEKASPESLFWLEDLLVAIRRDLGYPGTQLKRGDLLGLFVDDIQRYL